ncbi:MAG: PLDc_N domain-containing protein [Candidatus Omnitrophica bacterium]|nr:PLDc_N domain-containing protein [Candidatus Omnitrophota bacterium]
MTGLLGLIVLVLDIVAIVDIIKGNMETAKKILWVILVLILPLIGMVLYFLVAKKK